MHDIACYGIVAFGLPQYHMLPVNHTICHDHCLFPVLATTVYRQYKYEKIRYITNISKTRPILFPSLKGYRISAL